MRVASLLALGAALLFSSEPALASRCKPSQPASSSSTLSVPSSSSTASASPSPSLHPNLAQNHNFSQGSDGLDSRGLVAHPYVEGSHTYGPSTDCGSNPGDPATCYESYNAATSKSYTYWNQYNLPVVPGLVYKLSYRYRVLSISGGVDILYGFINGNNLGSISLSAATADIGV